MCTLATLRLQQTTLSERGLASYTPWPRHPLRKSGSLLLTLTKQEIISLSSKTSESLITLFTTLTCRGVNLCVTHRSLLHQEEPYSLSLLPPDLTHELCYIFLAHMLPMRLAPSLARVGRCTYVTHAKTSSCCLGCHPQKKTLTHFPSALFSFSSTKLPPKRAKDPPEVGPEHARERGWFCYYAIRHPTQLLLHQLKLRPSVL